MKIAKDLTIQDIFNQFSEQFPHLKLEFYSKPISVYEGSSANDQLPHDMSLGKINPTITETEWHIDKDMLVTDFEQYMKEAFGLYVQVFRRSNHLWLQTSATDGWSLDKQNGKGGRSMRQIDQVIDQNEDLD